MGMYLANRLLMTIPVLLIASVVVFSAVRLLPGDPVDALYPPTAALSPEARERLRERLGLGQPVPVQYIRWLGGAVRGDLGFSTRTRGPVTSLLADRAGATLRLVGLSTLFGLAIAVPLGTVAAIRRGTMLDTGATTFALIGLSVPSFALGTLFILIFGVWLRWVPTTNHLLLPVLTQGLATAGILVRNVRSGVLDHLRQDYVRTARGKGVPPIQLYARHILPNALSVTVSVLATVVGYQLGSAVVVEQIFSWPGLGSLMFESVIGRDYAVVQGIALVILIGYVSVNLLADLLRAAIDPRLR